MLWMDLCILLISFADFYTTDVSVKEIFHHLCHDLRTYR